MAVNVNELREHFGLLSDRALLATRREDLVEAAQNIFDEEVKKRGLTPGQPIEEEAEGEAQQDAAGEDAPAQAPVETVVLETFMNLDEANLARGLLSTAEIPSGLKADRFNPGVIQLLVPRDFEEAAREVLADGFISEEELAAQAEAAGAFEEEEPEE
jgi:hypothetical protein